MAYFTIKGNFLSLKNNLEKEVAQLIDSKNRMVINNDEIEIFKAEILLKIAEISLNNRRCKAPNASFHNSYSGNGDFFLEGFDTMKFHLYKSKN